VISSFFRKVDENCTSLDCYAVCSSRVGKELPLHTALWPRRAVFGIFFFSSIPLIGSVRVLDRITGFSSIEECSFPGVLMNVTVSIFSHLN